MERRRFLRLPENAASRELCCEALYMRLLDAGAEGGRDALLARLADELAGARSLRLRGAAWLEREELKRSLVPLLDAFRAKGGRVEPVA